MFENVKVGDEVALMSHGLRDTPPRKAVVTAVTKTQFQADGKRYLRSNGREYGSHRCWVELWTDAHQDAIDQHEHREYIRQLRERIERGVIRWTPDKIEQAAAVLTEAGLMRNDADKS